MSWEDELKRCQLAKGPFPPDARRCDWCGTGLEGRRRRWCSDDCSNAYTRNHAWSSARAAALERDQRRCVRCGSDGRHPAEFWYGYVVFWCGRFPPRMPTVPEWCRSHGWLAAESNEAIDAYLDWVRRRSRRWHVANELCLEARRRSRLEVNHKVPCLGRHHENSCVHHLDGLETLCHHCHLEETGRQRRAGLLTG